MKIIIVAITVVAVFGFAAQTEAKADAKKGKRLYMSYGCYQCHGREGQGSAATGPRLGPKPIPLQAFVRYVRRPAGQMPPYTANVVSDAELTDVYAFLESLPQPPAVKSIPLLN